MFWASMVAAHKQANLWERKKNRRKPLEFREDRMNLELRHQIFVECSGMHTRKIYNLVRKTCERGERKYKIGCCMSEVLSTTWTMCALTAGPDVYFDTILRTLGELAIYAALFLSVVLASSTAPPLIPDGLSRDVYILGQFGSYAFLGAVIFLHLALNLQSASYIRNSDKLYCIGKHLWKVFFLSFFCLITGVTFTIFSAAACLDALISGNYCLDGSISYADFIEQNLTKPEPLIGNLCATEPLKYQIFAFVALGLAVVFIVLTCCMGCMGI